MKMGETEPMNAFTGKGNTRDEETARLWKEIAVFTVGSAASMKKEERGEHDGLKSFTARGREPVEPLKSAPSV
jgi:hypothetical protein